MRSNIQKEVSSNLFRKYQGPEEISFSKIDENKQLTFYNRYTNKMKQHKRELNPKTDVENSHTAVYHDIETLTLVSC